MDRSQRVSAVAKRIGLLINSESSIRSIVRVAIPLYHEI